MKTCTACGREQPLDAFDEQAGCRDGRRPQCRDCRRAYNRAAYQRKRAGLPGLRQPVPDGEKWCPQCRQVRPLEDFPRNRSTSSGRASYCRPCHNAAGRLSKERVGGSRAYHLKRRYGLTSADVDALVEAQGGRCAVCRERDPQHVDHDHVTGQVRGVLCSGCNQGLGNFRDRADLLREASAYLHRTTGQPVVEREAPGVYRVRAL